MQRKWTEEYFNRERSIKGFFHDFKDFVLSSGVQGKTGPKEQSARLSRHFLRL